MEVYDERLPKGWDDIPKFDGNPCSTITHVVEFIKYIYWYQVTRDDFVTQLFFLSLDKKQRNLINHTCLSSGFDSSTIFIREFLKQRGPKSHQLKYIFQDLKDVSFGSD
jgi:hypothetical protein